MHLRTIPHLAAAFGLPVGLSDHTLGIAVPVAAVALGACIVEKHFTLSRSRPGPDSAFSLEPGEFKEMVAAIRVAEQALGEVRYDLTEQEAASRVFRRSLFVVAGHEGGRDFHRGERPLHPPGPRPGAQVFAGGPGAKGRSGYQERHPSQSPPGSPCLRYRANLMTPGKDFRISLRESKVANPFCNFSVLLQCLVSLYSNLPWIKIPPALCQPPGQILIAVEWTQCFATGLLSRLADSWYIGLASFHRHKVAIYLGRWRNNFKNARSFPIFLYWKEEITIEKRPA